MSIVNTHRLAFVGPRDDQHGFPLWYEDETGTRLALGLAQDPNTPAIGELPQPGSPLSFPANFPDESFYFMAESRMSVGGAGVVGRARLILALEAAFGGAGVPAPDAHVVFARIRVRMDDVIPGATYVVTHPYGQTDALTADEDGRVFDTDDRGIADEQLDAVLRAGLVAPFLRWTAGAPARYLGDGVSERPVTGSPFGTNFFRIDGPDVAAAGGPVDPGDPTNPDRIQSSLFTVQGKEAPRLGVELTSATYTRTGPAIVVDLHATSAEGQALETSGAGLPRVALGTTGRHYTARAEAGAVPATAEVVNVTDEPVSRSTRDVVDRVDIDVAEFSPSAQTLTVSARSSDDTGPALQVEGIGALTATPTVFPGLGGVPAEIVVTSGAGGRASRLVSLKGPANPDLPIVADAGPDVSVVTGTVASLDGTGSRGGVTSWSWSQTTGTTVTLNDDTTPQPSFTAPAPETLSFELTVQGPSGQDSDTVDLVVVPVPPPDQITVEQAQFRTGRQQYRVSGTLVGTPPSTVVVSFAGTDLGQSAVDATGAWDVRRTLTAAETNLRPTAGSQVEVRSTTGVPVLAAISIRN